MEWKHEYALGIEEIDRQHKTLLQFIGEFEQAFAGNGHWNTLQPLLARTREFVKFHFAVEESLMQIVGYPGFAAHKAEHHQVLEQLAALEHQVLRQETKLELQQAMRTWLFQHIIASDQPFARYAVAKFPDLARGGIKGA
jgi:hemerythrin